MRTPRQATLISPLTLTLVLLLLAAKTTAQTYPPPRKECRAGCTSCVYACYNIVLWNPVGIYCTMCQDCVLTPITSTRTSTSTGTGKEIEVPGCVVQDKDPAEVGDEPLCTMVCGHGINANCMGVAICLDDEYVPPATPTIPWPHIETTTTTLTSTTTTSPTTTSDSAIPMPT